MKEKEKFGRNQFILMFFAFSFGMILSNLIAQKNDSEPLEEPKYLFVYKGMDQGIGDISKTIADKLESLSREKRHLLELAAIERHVHQYAADKGMNINDAAKELLVIQEVTQDEISQFYHDNETTLAKPFHEVRDSIARRLKNEAITSAKRSLLIELQKSGDLAFLEN